MMGEDKCVAQTRTEAPGEGETAQVALSWTRPTVRVMTGVVGTGGGPNTHNVLNAENAYYHPVS